MQAAGAADLLEFLFQPHDAIADQPPVGLDLGFAGAAEEAEAAALTLKMGPGADQAGALIIEMGEFDLQDAFAGAGAGAENVQDQAGAVDDLAAPGLFQVALLHRGKLGVDNDDADLVFLEQGFLHRDLALAEQHRRPAGAQR